MSEEFPFISIILPVFNEERYLGQCLANLLKVDYPNDRFEIIVVDNGSTDNSITIASEYTNNVFKLTDVNVGAVRNFGVKKSSGDFLAFLDSDCLIPKDWLIRGIEFLQGNIKSVFGGNLYLRDKPYWIEKYWLLDTPDSPKLQSELLGSCIFIKKDDFLAAGGMNETVTSGEDSELSQSLKKLGYKVIIEKSLGVVHLGNPTTAYDFIKRQIWHSENYLKSIRESMVDIVFWLVVIYLLGFVGSVLFLFTSTPSIILPVSLAAIFTPPALLSLKRILRAGFKPRTLIDVFSIYLIDHFYLLGRVIGLLKGIFPK